jgi:hypothetical protein
MPITFTATASDAKRCGVNYAWSFGGAGTGTGASVTRMFANLGHLAVHVRAVGCGRTVSGSADVWVVAHPCADAEPFDLHWTVRDPNGLPMDPEWRWQCDYAARASGAAASGYLDPNVYCKKFAQTTPAHVLEVGSGCSREIAQAPDEPTDPLWSTICHFKSAFPFLDGDGTVHGHVNWQAVMYKGTVTFQEVQKDFPSGLGDGDADLNLVPSTDRVLRARSPEGVSPKRQLVRQHMGHSAGASAR